MLLVPPSLPPCIHLIACPPRAAEIHRVLIHPTSAPLEQKKAMGTEGAAIARASGVAVALLTAATSATRVPFSDLPRVSYQPSNIAFAIWWVIYALLFVSIQTLCGAVDDDAINLYVGFLIGALCMCTAWALLASASYSRLAPIAIGVATLLAAATIVAIPIQSHQPRTWLLGAGPGLLLGWLVVASGLAIGSVITQLHGDEPSQWVMLPGALIAIVASLVSQNPFPQLAILWGVIFSPRTRVAATLAVIATIGLVGVAIDVARGD